MPAADRDDRIATPDQHEDCEDHAHRLATLAHLADIRREHGAGKRWASYALAPATPRSLYGWRVLAFSASGSPAAMCMAARTR
jgi:hypothetical protein